MPEIKFAYAVRDYDYAGAIERVAGDGQLLHSLLDMFLEDKSYDELMSALTELDAQEGFRAAHSLKGSSGMLGLTGLFEAMKRITEPLRRGDIRAALEYRGEVEREYAEAVGMIKSL